MRRSIIFVLIFPGVSKEGVLYETQVHRMKTTRPHQDTELQLLFETCLDMVNI
jgi:hypothetical protein